MYYITFAIKYGKLSEDDVMLVLNHIRAGHGIYYQLYAAQVMPDHVHVILKPHDNYSLSRIMKGLKGISARKIYTHRMTEGSIWQSESFDRIIRSENDLIEKLKYIYNNPLRANITEDPDKYCGLHSNDNIMEKGNCQCTH